jgi:hypothetical protein
VEPHGGPATVPGNGRLGPNPAKLPEALERLPHHAGFRQPGPVIAVDLAGSKRARQPPSSHPASPGARPPRAPVRHCRVQPPRMGTPPRYSVRYGGIDAFNARMTAEKERRSPRCDGNWRDPSPAHRLHPERARRSAQPRDALRRCLRLDTYGHYPQHAETIRQWRRRRTVDPRALGSLPMPGAQ